MNELPHDPLREALRALPRHGASPGFEARLRAELEARDAGHGRARPISPARAMALAAGLALALGSGWLVARDRAVDEKALRLAELRHEQHQLAAELAAIKRQAVDDRAVVYLGGDDQTDLVMDLESLAHRSWQIRHASNPMR